MLAIIGGSGIKGGFLTDARDEEVETPYGPALVTRGLLEGQPVLLLYRHGPGHTVPPHRINYRANIWALRKLGVNQVLATAAVGSLNPALQPGDMVLVDQFLDFTKGRAHSFYDGGPEGVVHVDVTEPYCPRLRERLAEAAAALGIAVTRGGVYAAAEGPRYETPAEIRAYRMLGADVVGMTGVPEVVLAREAGLCYATVAMVTNMAAGIAGGTLSHEEVEAVMDAHGHRIRRLATRVLEGLGGTGGGGGGGGDGCPCRRYGHLTPGFR